jgi:diguanylate cyclase (GGDEF)-like protein/PAS domain S-box-containing protein
VFPPRAALTNVHSKPLARVLVVVGPILGPLLVAVAFGAAVGADSDFPGATLGAGLVIAGFSALLIRRAWRIHRPTPHPADRRTSFSSRGRSPGMLGVGFGVAAATCLIGAVLYLSGTAPTAVADVVAIGFTGCMAAFIPALIMMPGAATNPIARIRRALDSVSVGICLLFTSWVLVIAPNGEIDSLAFWIAMLTCCGLAFALISALRAGSSRRSAYGYAGALSAAVVGLNGLSFSLANGFLVGWPTFFALSTAAGAALAWFGVTQAAEEADMAPLPDSMTTLAEYPVSTIPAAAAVAVGLHRLITGGTFDRPSVLLGVLGIVVLVVREWFGALDASRYARQVGRQEAQFRSLVARSTDVIMILDDDQIVRWQSGAAARQFGLSDQDVVGRHFPSMLHPADAVAAAERLADVRVGLVGGAGEHPTLVEARLRDGFGQWRETEFSISDQRDAAAVSGIVVHIRDIGERREMERTLHRLAYADPLTGLANRRQVLLSVLALRSNARARGALLLLELDGFTSVNDVRGYDTGDAVLVEVARRLRVGARETDMPARLSGAGFALVTEDTPVAAYALATRMVTMLAEPVVLPGATIRLTASVGVAEIAGGRSSDDVLRRADLALRRAKQLGRGRVEWYDEAVQRAMLRRMTIEQELPGALERGEFDLIYQPILDLEADRPLAVEALLRWRHPRLNTLLPGEVIPVAEELGLMTDIGSWVINKAARQLAKWLREGRDLSIGVNVSPQQLRGDDLPLAVRDSLRLHKVPAERLVVELSEGGLAGEAVSAAQRLGELRSMGVRTALDEFGSGVESLTHLRRLPVDMVKVGRSFYAGPTESPGQSVPIIDVMVGLGRRLGIDVVAQGLEAPAHLELVRGAGCRFGQGHLFARPQPAERIEAYLDGFPAR